MGLVDSEEGMRGIGLGKGKPFCAGKIAKKKLGLPNNILMSLQSYNAKAGGVTGRKGAIAAPYQKKHQKMAEFGRKRGAKSKMRGVFGVPGLGLQVNITTCTSRHIHVLYFYCVGGILAWYSFSFSLLNLLCRG